MASRELLTRLESVLPGAVLPPNRGDSDDEVWSRAQASAAAILTGNAVDFRPLAEVLADHHGLLLVYRENDPTRDLRAADIAARIAAIAARYPDGLESLVLVVNTFADD
jgi:hypothetical protein